MAISVNINSLLASQSYCFILRIFLALICSLFISANVPPFIFWIHLWLQASLIYSLFLNILRSTLYDVPNICLLLSSVAEFLFLQLFWQAVRFTDQFQFYFKAIAETLRERCGTVYRAALSQLQRSEFNTDLRCWLSAVCTCIRHTAWDSISRSYPKHTWVGRWIGACKFLTIAELEGDWELRVTINWDKCKWVLDGWQWSVGHAVRSNIYVIIKSPGTHC